MKMLAGERGAPSVPPEGGRPGRHRRGPSPTRGGQWVTPLHPGRPQTHEFLEHLGWKVDSLLGVDPSELKAKSQLSRVRRRQEEGVIQAFRVRDAVFHIFERETSRQMGSESTPTLSVP